MAFNCIFVTILLVLLVESLVTELQHICAVSEYFLVWLLLLSVSAVLYETCVCVCACVCLCMYGFYLTGAL